MRQQQLVTLEVPATRSPPFPSAQPSHRGGRGGTSATSRGGRGDHFTRDRRESSRDRTIFPRDERRERRSPPGDRRERYQGTSKNDRAPQTLYHPKGPIGHR